MNKGFYKNASTMSPFQFDRIYPNKYEMDKEAATDGVLIGRYVLVEYGNEQEGSNNNYQENLKKDNNGQVDIQNLVNYDSTIWQKILDKKKDQQGKIIFEEKYVHIASLNAEVPISYKVIEADEKPKIEIEYPKGVGKYHEPNYVINLPKAWDIKIKDAEYPYYSDEVEEIQDENSDKVIKRDLNIYYNKKAFNNIDFKNPVKYESKKYYYSEENPILLLENRNEMDTVSEKGILYVLDKNIIKTNQVDELLSEEYDGKNYYNIKLFNKNDYYLWEDIIKDNSSESYYVLGDPTFLFLDDNNELTTINDPDKYLFQKRVGNDYENIYFSDSSNKVKELKELINDKVSIIYFEYENLKEKTDPVYKSNNLYYKYINEDYEEITVITQSNNPPYNVAKEDINDSVKLYYKHKGRADILDNNEAPTENREYYILDENGNREYIIFEDENSKYKYYETSNEEEAKEYIYEKEGENYYYLAESKPDMPYYKKVSYGIKDDIKNKVSLESTEESIKELSFILPGLGNAIAEVYNLLYGEGDARSSFIYDDYAHNPNMYDDNGETKVPLYNVDKKTVIGLMNSIYDDIGRMDVIDGTGYLTKTEDGEIEVKSDTNIEELNLIETIFQLDDGTEYIILKIWDSKEETYYYKAKEFNKKSLYHLIAEMQHLVLGSYEGIFKALDEELDIIGDPYIDVNNIKDSGRFYYELKHKKNFDQTTNDQPNNAYLTISLNGENDNIGFSFISHPVDEAGHIVKDTKTTWFDIPRAYAKIDGIDTSAPIGSFWYDRSDIEKVININYNCYLASRDNISLGETYSEQKVVSKKEDNFILNVPIDIGDRKIANNYKAYAFKDNNNYVSEITFENIEELNDIEVNLYCIYNNLDQNINIPGLILLGDVDGNNSISTLDASKIARYLEDPETHPLKEQEYIKADIDNDKILTEKEVETIRKIAGKQTSRIRTNIYKDSDGNPFEDSELEELGFLPETTVLALYGEKIGAKVNNDGYKIERIEYNDGINPIEEYTYDGFINKDTIVWKDFTATYYGHKSIKTYKIEYKFFLYNEEHDAYDQIDISDYQYQFDKEITEIREGYTYKNKVIGPENHSIYYYDLEINGINIKSQYSEGDISFTVPFDEEGENIIIKIYSKVKPASNE